MSTLESIQKRLREKELDTLRARIAHLEARDLEQYVPREVHSTKRGAVIIAFPAPEGVSARLGRVAEDLDITKRQAALALIRWAMDASGKGRRVHRLYPEAPEAPEDPL